MAQAPVAPVAPVEDLVILQAAVVVAEPPAVPVL